MNGKISSRVCTLLRQFTFLSSSFMVIVEQACRLHDLSVRIGPVVRADVGKIVASPKGALMSELKFYFTFHLRIPKGPPSLGDL